MAKFVFRFKSLLRVKEKLEEQQKLEYGKALRKVEEEKQKKRRMLQEQEAVIASFKEGLNKKISPADVQRHNNFLAYIKEAIAKQEREINRALNYAEERRILLEEAVKARKIVEKVKDNDYESYAFGEKKLEELATDGVVSFKYANR